ncbi:Uncharacterised protein [Yersinia enterocolitica]|nr:Uncharacterised protein [Yersinia enterocolitica]
MWAGFNFLTRQGLSDDRRISRLNRNRGDRLAFSFFNVTADTGQSTAGTNTCDKDIHFTIGVFPDFWASGLFVNFRVCWVTELLQDNIAIWVGGLNFFRFGYRPFHPLSTFGQHQIGTQCFEQFTALNTHGFRHGQGQFITARGCNKCQCDAGIATGRFYQFFVCGQNATIFGVPNHIGTDTAFNTETWIA